jgi:hypothetical protein
LWLLAWSWREYGPQDQLTQYRQSGNKQRQKAATKAANYSNLK